MLHQLPDLRDSGTGDKWSHSARNPRQIPAFHTDFTQNDRPGPRTLRHPGQPTNAQMPVKSQKAAHSAGFLADCSTPPSQIPACGITAPGVPGGRAGRARRTGLVSSDLIHPGIRSWKADEGRKWVRLRLTRWVEQGRRAATGPVCPCSSSTAAQRSRKWSHATYPPYAVGASSLPRRWNCPPAGRNLKSSSPSPIG